MQDYTEVVKLMEADASSEGREISDLVSHSKPTPPLFVFVIFHATRLCYDQIWLSEDIGCLGHQLPLVFRNSVGARWKSMPEGPLKRGSVKGPLG